MDYKDLFKKVENAIAVYNSELDHSAGGVEPEVFVQDRLKKGRERLDSALETLVLLCEPVEPPKGELEHIHYFCGNTEIPSDLQEREPQRTALYKATVALVRAYANISDELEPAGYTLTDIARIKDQLNYYLDVRETIRKARPAAGREPRQVRRGGARDLRRSISKLPVEARTPGLGIDQARGGKCPGPDQRFGYERLRQHRGFPREATDSKDSKQEPTR